MRSLDDLIDKGKFSELIMFSWSMVETMIEEVFLQQFSVSLYSNSPSESESASLLVELSFNKKKEFLGKCGIITREELGVLTKFQKERNDMFHSWGFIIELYSQEYRKGIMDDAKEAAGIAFDIAKRKNSPLIKGLENYLQEKS